MRLFSVRRLAFALTLLLAVHCRPLLPRRATIERSRDVGGIAFDGMNISSDFRFPAFGECKDPSKAACKGADLHPGDVLYLRRWWPSTNDRTAHDLQWTGPLSVSERIPLRYVDETKGMLYPQERELLATILTTERSKKFNELQKGAVLRGLATALNTNERPLWNKLVEGMKVKRVKDGGDDSLLLVVPIEQMCNALSPDHRAYFRCTATDSPYAEAEVVGITQPYASPWEAMLGAGAGQKEITANEHYYTYQRGAVDSTAANAPTATTPCNVGGDGQPPSSDPAIVSLQKRQTEMTAQIASLTARATTEKEVPALGKPWTTYNFVDVELNGIDMRDRGDAERRWTLADWDEAQICRSPDGVEVAHIAEVTFVGSVLQFRVVDDGRETEKVDIDVSGRGRFLRRISVKTDSCRACENISRIPRADLRLLYPHDVTRIVWSYNDAAKKTHLIRIPNCSPRG